MKKRGVWVTVLFACLLLAGCKRYEAANVTAEQIETEAETKTVILEPETEAEEDAGAQKQIREEKDGMIQSFLTGEMTDAEIAGRRPIAIMISNDKQALPHYGINHAGVVYEAPVEGVMNRYMAIIENYDDLERIGSVRSSRTYYTFFAREFEAIYAHFGQSVFALPYLSKMDHLNGIEGKGAVAFYRSKDRKAPHNAYASAAGIKKAIADSGYSEEYPAEYSGHYRFAKTDKPELLNEGFYAGYVKPGYDYNTPWFEYNKEDSLYYRYQYGGPHNGDDGPIKVKNLIFQYCPTGFYKSSEYLDIDVYSPGLGYFFSNGKGVAVTWQKEGAYGPTRYYKNDGSEILLNPGKTWVCIVPLDRLEKAEYYGN